MEMLNVGGGIAFGWINGDKTPSPVSAVKWGMKNKPNPVGAIKMIMKKDKKDE